MFDITLFDAICKELKIEKMVDVTISTKENKKFDAEYSPVYREMKNGGIELRKHRIKVFIGDELTRPIDSLIAHELIHAWQEERDLSEIHGKYFRRKAKQLESLFGMEDIYIPELDSD